MCENLAFFKSLRIGSHVAKEIVGARLWPAFSLVPKFLSIFIGTLAFIHVSPTYCIDTRRRFMSDGFSPSCVGKKRKEKSDALRVLPHPENLTMNILNTSYQMLLLFQCLRKSSKVTTTVNATTYRNEQRNLTRLYL